MSESFLEYRTRVLGYLGSRDPVTVLRATSNQLTRILTGASRLAVTTRPAPGKWSVLEIVAHLADAELAWSWRLRNAIAAPGVALAWWDESVWAERLGYQNIPWRTSVGRFKALRLANLGLLSVPCHLLRGMHAMGRMRHGGVNPSGTSSLSEAAHDLNHLRQIKTLVTSGMRGAT